jgi:Cu/Ag efflux pump CusA
MDFESLLTKLDPKIYFGGDNVAFWGPLSWTMIFGISFATIITLILVPAMYIMSERLKKRSIIILNHFEIGQVFMYVPFMILILRLVLKIKGTRLNYGDLNG